MSKHEHDMLLVSAAAYDRVDDAVADFERLADLRAHRAESLTLPAEELCTNRCHSIRAASPDRVVAS